MKKQNEDNKDKLEKNEDHTHFHLIGSGFNTWIIWQITTLIGIYLGSIIPEKLGLTFAIPLTFLALLVNDFRKFINIIVIIVSGSIATIGYQMIPYKAYVIVAASVGLFVAFILTKFINKYNE